MKPWVNTLGYDHALNGASTSTAPNIDATAPSINVVWKSVTKLKTGKSPAPDRISAEMLRLGGDVVATALHKILLSSVGGRGAATGVDGCDSCASVQEKRADENAPTTAALVYCQWSGRYSCHSSDHGSLITGKGEQGNSRQDSVAGVDVWTRFSVSVRSLSDESEVARSLLRSSLIFRLPSTVCIVCPCGRPCWWMEYRSKSSTSCAAMMRAQNALFGCMANSSTASMSLPVFDKAASCPRWLLILLSTGSWIALVPPHLLSTKICQCKTWTTPMTSHIWLTLSKLVKHS